MALWHFLHTTRVFLRRAAIVFFHSVRSFFSPWTSASFLMWCTSTSSVDPHISHLSARNLCKISVCPLRVVFGVWSSIFPNGFRISEKPPNLAIKAFLPSLTTVTCMHFRVFPSSVTTLAAYFIYIAFTDALCLAASVLRRDCFHNPFQVVAATRRLEPGNSIDTALLALFGIQPLLNSRCLPTDGSGVSVYHSACILRLSFAFCLWDTLNAIVPLAVLLPLVCFVLHCSLMIS